MGEKMLDMKFSLLAFIVLLASLSFRHGIAFKLQRQRRSAYRIAVLMNDDKGQGDIPLKIWKQTKTILPPVVTGDYTGERGDGNPLAALYNMLFVRIPTIAAGILYASKLNDSSWTLICDVGLGPFEVPPSLVALIVLVILS